MICASVVPCLSSGLAKNDKLCPCLFYVIGFFGHFEIWPFFRKWGDKPCTKSVKQDVFSQFFKGTAFK